MAQKVCYSGKKIEIFAHYEKKMLFYCFSNSILEALFLRMFMFING